ncbi:FAD-dependent oxidoreductase [Oleomonas cavernae]|uniref:FAD-dependent oxidoreductase n=1 Tax=Oleomonas cavernae TaxID=2320859 RepID=A0A418WH01_9PROT|nr:FAD-dependent oxidoreductase [Oleomonas cavernae]RJF89313.1 FAD-dependent oxidoreductase [Oleomonas cavernae]
MIATSKAAIQDDVVIYGGGMAGALLAKALAPEFRVTLVDPNEYFEVPMSVPRSLVKPGFADAAIIPFAAALPGVAHVRGALVEMHPEGGLVQLKNGKEELLKGRVSVLATGSKFSNALMRAIDGASVRERKEFYVQYHRRIVASQNILIVGGGPIGVEVAGEIIENHPAKKIIILEAGPRVLAGTSEAAAAQAAKVLKASGVTVLTDERLECADSTVAEVLSGAGEALTSRGQSIPYDLLIWCVGGKPNTAYMAQHYASTLNQAGRIRVSPDLRVVGSDTVFALGDITDLDENKMAWHIGGQIRTAAHNIRAILTRAGRPSRLKAHKPQTGNPMMAVTLGSRNGVLHLPVIGVVRSPFVARVAKSSHMLVPKFRKALGV